MAKTVWVSEKKIVGIPMLNATSFTQYTINPDNTWTKGETKKGSKLSDTDTLSMVAMDEFNWSQGMTSMDDFISQYAEKQNTGWGAGSVSKDDFIDPSTGKPRTLEDIKSILGPKLPGLKGNALEKQIIDMAPKYTEDVYGMGKEKEFAKQDYEKDVYGLQKGAREIGGAMRKSYGGMGGGMRAGIGAKGALGAQFEEAGQAYEKSMYGIEKAGEEKYEQDIAGWLDTEWFKPQGKEGGYVKRDRSGITNNLEETFLDVLSQLPDAGGS